jgi:hypothetical protein
LAILLFIARRIFFKSVDGSIFSHDYFVFSLYALKHIYILLEHIAVKHIQLKL